MHLLLSADMEEELFESLNSVSPHLKMYRRDELPDRFHYHIRYPYHHQTLRRMRCCAVSNSAFLLYSA